MADAGLYIDWANDGFGAAGSDDDVTGRLRSATWSRGGTPVITGGAQTGTARFTLQNIDGRFSPDNTASPLYPNVKPGRLVWFGLNSDRTLTPGGDVKIGRASCRERV